MANSVKIVSITKPLVEGVETAEEFVSYCARVSNPSNQLNMMTSPRLLRYLIAHRHWSPFEMVHITFEINTTRDIAHQIVRHRSFSFQEWSQRYADPTKDMGFTFSEARLQDLKNRQNSIEVDNEMLQMAWKDSQKAVIDAAKRSYHFATENGIAKEVARKVLPEGLTNTRLYMSGTLRSAIHWIDVRTDPGTQKEHRELAEAAREEVLNHFPSLRDYWFPPVEEVVKKPWWKFW